MAVIQVTLEEKEILVLRKAIAHCVQECRQGGSEAGCEDCLTLEQIQKKLFANNG